MKWILALGMVGATVASFLTSPAGGFLKPDLARIIFFHLPCAFATVVFVIWAAIASVNYLRKRDWIWELRSNAAVELATTFAVATMVTGILFSWAQWNRWWHWDPRQTSFLIVLLLLGAHFALRAAFEEPVLRARASCAYSVITILPVLFLIFVFPRLPQAVKASLHPGDTIQKNAFSSEYWTLLLVIFALLLWLGIWLYQMHVRSSAVADSLKDYYGDLEADSSGSSADRVVRPVPLR